MKSLEKGQDKIQKICDQLRRQTLEPAKQEAAKIVEEAKQQAACLQEEAMRQAELLLKQAQRQIEQERAVFHSSLQQAAKQALEGLRQEIEQKLFNQELEKALNESLSDPTIIAKCINGMIQAVEKEGLATDLAAIIPEQISPLDVYGLLLDRVKKRLNKQPLEVGSFQGGAQLRLVDRKMTLDLSNQAIKELLAHYLRKDFRAFIFLVRE